MIVWLSSYPRSGNTFFRMLLYHSAGYKSYSLYREADFEKRMGPEMAGFGRLPGPLDELARAAEVYFIKTHDLPADDHPAIYLVRDGRDAVVSYAHFLNDFSRKEVRGVKKFFKKLLPRDEFIETLEELIISKKKYGGWNDNVSAWSGRAGSRTLLIRYEDLVADPDRWLREALQHLGMPSATPGGRSTPDFATLHERWPRFFRRGKIGGWRDEMPERLHAAFWEHHGAAMSALGYER